MYEMSTFWTEFHDTWWSYRYMFLVGSKVFSFVVKGVKVIFEGFKRGGGYKSTGLKNKLKATFEIEQC
jgi:hypothetical protein